MKRLLLILALATLASASMAAWLHSKLESERAQVAALESRVAELERAPPSRSLEPVKSEERIDASPGRIDGQTIESLPAAQKQVRFAPAATAVASQRMRPDQTQLRRIMEGQRELMKDPEYREALRVQTEFSLRQTHADLAEELGLSREDAESLISLLTQQQLRRQLEADAFMHENSDPAAMAEIQKRHEEWRRKESAEIEEILGPDGTQRWREYEQSFGVRHRIRQLGGVLDAAGIPLREDQRPMLRSALVEIERQSNHLPASLARMSPQTPEDQLKWQEELLSHRERMNENAHQQLSYVLSSQQLDTFRQIQEQELALQRAHLRMQRAQMKLGTSSGNSFVVAPGVAVSTVLSESPSDPE